MKLQLNQIAGANSNGWVSILTKTGVYAGGEHEATHLVDDVEVAVNLILKHHHH